MTTPTLSGSAVTTTGEHPWLTSTTASSQEERLVHVTAYQFSTLTPDQLKTFCDELTALITGYGVLGSILLSEEGMNLSLAGPFTSISQVQQALVAHPWISNEIAFKSSYCDRQPYRRLKVRIKNEIIRMGNASVRPDQRQAAYITPPTLHDWYATNKPFIMLDVRNDYELELGHFEKAVDLKIKQFTEFPEAVAALPEAYRSKPIVTVCTGGIRCEKAALCMKDLGYEQVYQLEGGILDYFRQCGGDYYEGECFVFDRRVAIHSDLTESDTRLCYDCHTFIQDDPNRTVTQCPSCDSHRVY